MTPRKTPPKAAQVTATRADHVALFGGPLAALPDIGVELPAAALEAADRFATAARRARELPNVVTEVTAADVLADDWQERLLTIATAASNKDRAAMTARRVRDQLERQARKALRAHHGELTAALAAAWEADQSEELSRLVTSAWQAMHDRQLEFINDTTGWHLRWKFNRAAYRRLVASTGPMFDPNGRRPDELAAACDAVASLALTREEVSARYEQASSHAPGELEENPRARDDRTAARQAALGTAQIIRDRAAAHA